MASFWNLIFLFRFCFGIETVWKTSSWVPSDPNITCSEPNGACIFQCSTEYACGGNHQISSNTEGEDTETFPFLICPPNGTRCIINCLDHLSCDHLHVVSGHCSSVEINIQKGSNNEMVINGPRDGQLSINLISDKAVFTESVINSDSTDSITLNCDGLGKCSGTIINGESVRNQLNVTCSHGNDCNDLEIHCPDNNRRYLNPQCHIQCEGDSFCSEMNIFAMNGTNRRNGVQFHCDSTNDHICDDTRIHCSDNRICTMQQLQLQSSSHSEWQCLGECGTTTTTTTTTTTSDHNSDDFEHPKSTEQIQGITSDDLMATTSTSSIFWRRSASTTTLRYLRDYEISVNVDDDTVIDADLNELETSNPWSLQIVLYLALGGLLGGGAFCVCILCGICCFLRERVHEQRKRLEQDSNSMTQSWSGTSTETETLTDDESEFESESDDRSYSMTNSTKRYYINTMTRNGSNDTISGRSQYTATATSRNLSSARSRTSKSRRSQFWKHTPSFGSMVIHDIKGTFNELMGLELLSPVEEEQVDDGHDGNEVGDIDKVDHAMNGAARIRLPSESHDRNHEEDLCLRSAPSHSRNRGDSNHRNHSNRNGNRGDELFDDDDDGCDKGLHIVFEQEEEEEEEEEKEQHPKLCTFSASSLPSHPQHDQSTIPQIPSCLLEQHRLNRSIMAYSDGMELFEAQNGKIKRSSLALSDAVPLPLPLSSTDGDEESKQSDHDSMHSNLGESMLCGQEPTVTVTVTEETRNDNDVDAVLKLGPSKSSHIQSAVDTLDSNQATRGTETGSTEVSASITNGTASDRDGDRGRDRDQPEVEYIGRDRDGEEWKPQQIKPHERLHALNIVVTVPKNQSMTMSNGGSLTHNRSITVSDAQQHQLRRDQMSSIPNNDTPHRMTPHHGNHGNLESIDPSRSITVITTDIERLSRPKQTVIKSRSSALAVDDSFDDEVDSSNLTVSSSADRCDRKSTAPPPFDPALAAINAVNEMNGINESEQRGGRKSSVSLLSFVESKQRRHHDDSKEVSEDENIREILASLHPDARHESHGTPDTAASRTTLTFPRTQLYDANGPGSRPESHDLEMGPSMQTATTMTGTATGTGTDTKTSSVPVRLQSISAMTRMSDSCDGNEDSDGIDDIESETNETLKTRITQHTEDEDVSDCYASTNPPMIDDHGIHVHGTSHSGFTGGTTSISKFNASSTGMTSITEHSNLAVRHHPIHHHRNSHNHHRHHRGTAHLRFDRDHRNDIDLNHRDGRDLLTVQRAREQMASSRRTPTNSSTETSTNTDDTRTTGDITYSTSDDHHTMTSGTHSRYRSETDSLEQNL